MTGTPGQAAFLLRLGDALGRLTDPVEGTALRMFGEWSGATWAYYLAVDASQSIATIVRDYTRDDVPSMIGEHSLADLGELMERITVVESFAEDFATTTIVSERARDVYRGIGMRSFLCAPVLRGGKVEAALTLADTVGRDWAPLMTVAGEAARRTWQAIARARAEAALRESIEHQPGGLNCEIDFPLIAGKTLPQRSGRTR